MRLYIGSTLNEIRYNNLLYKRMNDFLKIDMEETPMSVNINLHVIRIPMLLNIVCVGINVSGGNLYIQNKKGPMMNPWGTPQVSHQKRGSLTTTKKVQFAKDNQDLNLS